MLPGRVGHSAEIIVEILRPCLKKVSNPSSRIHVAIPPSRSIWLEDERLDYNHGNVRLFDNLNQRDRRSELMDAPQLDRSAHLGALRGLTRIYRASRTGAALWPIIRSEARTINGPLRVLDVATGGGDFPIEMAHRARKEGIAIDAFGCDMSRTAVAFARLRARNNQSTARFFALDIERHDIPSGFHVVTSGLFLHHLDAATAVEFLRRMAGATLQLAIVDDLRRTRLGLGLAWIATRGLSRSKIVHIDGIRSVRAAFTTGELSELAAAAGLVGSRITTHWPERQLLTWRRPAAPNGHANAR